MRGRLWLTVEGLRPWRLQAQVFINRPSDSAASTLHLNRVPCSRSCVGCCCCCCCNCCRCRVVITTDIADCLCFCFRASYGCVRSVSRDTKQYNFLQLYYTILSVNRFAGSSIIFLSPVFTDSHKIYKLKIPNICTLHTMDNWYTPSLSGEEETRWAVSCQPATVVT